MAKELVYKVRIEMDSSSATKSTSRLENTQENAEKAVNKTTAAINRQIQATEGSAQSQRNFAKATSNANQTLFSFGDLVNDSAQFQFGFAQGSRAIGNNIGFMAEQFSNVQTRAGSFTAALKAMGSSLLGPGGLILGINIVVTAITLFGDKLFDTGEKAKDLNEELDRTIDRINGVSQALAQEGIFGEDTFNVTVLEDNIRRLNERLKTNETIIKELSLSEEQLARLKELRFIRDQQGISLTAEQTKELKRLARIQKQNADVVAEYEKENEKLTEEVDTLNQKLADQRRVQREVEDTTGGLTLGLSDLAEQYIDTSIQIASFNDQLFLQIKRQREAQSQLFRDSLPEVQATGQLGFSQEEINRQKELAKDLGTTREAIFKDIASKEVSTWEDKEKAKTAIERIEARQRAELQRQAVSQSIGALASAFDQFKPLAVAQAVIDGVLAVQKVLANVPPPFNFAAAGAMAAATAKNVQKIIATEPGSVDTGGAGGGGSDRGFGGQAGNFIGNTGQRDPVPPGRLDRIGGSGRRENINVIVRADRKGFAAWVESGNKERKSGVFTLRSDV